MTYLAEAFKAPASTAALLAKELREDVERILWTTDMCT